MDPWINLSLKPPPVLTITCNNSIDTQSLKHACENILRVLSKQSPLYKEGALLSRFIYKYDKKFRHDIGYRNLRKTYSSLHKYIQIDLLRDVENFMSVLPIDDEDFAPTRQMLEYVLCRLITFSKLMLRICVYSKRGAVFYLDRIKKAQNHWMSLMPFALLSRIWSVGNVLLHHATSWYSSLHPFLCLLQVKGLTFLPESSELPQDLYDWLNLNQSDTFGKFNWSERKTMNFDLGWEDDVDLFDNMLEYVNNINDKINSDTIEDSDFVQELRVKIEPKIQQIQTSILTKVDCGEVMSRDNFKHLCSSSLSVQNSPKEDKIQNVSKARESCRILENFQKKITEENKVYNHYFGKISNVQTLEKFIEKEETFRNEGSEHSLTKHLSFMQWHTLKTALLKVAGSVLNNKKIEKKLGKVWKEKCLDYL